MTKKRVAILGSTGSVGRQTIDVIMEHPDLFEVSLLSAHDNFQLLIEQAKHCEANTVVITNESHYSKVEDELWKEDIKTYAGHQALNDCVQMDEIDIVVAGIVGFAGLSSTIAAIEAGKNIALANKETLVVAGEIIAPLALKKGVNIYPVDSEHSAIFQCLMGEFQNPIEKIILTASGGPFLGASLNDLQNVGVADALNHPKWKMGNKISIDSATMINKGLEVIEAKWLFNLKVDQIEVVVHPESIVHSLVQFADGSVKAQLGSPDMKVPIQFALTYPKREKMNTERLNLSQIGQLNFYEPDWEVFDGLSLAFEVLQAGGCLPAVFNAVNEELVQAFLKEQINFVQITSLNRQICEKFTNKKVDSMEVLLEADSHARTLVRQLIAE